MKGLRYPSLSLALVWVGGILFLLIMQPPQVECCCCAHAAHSHNARWRTNISYDNCGCNFLGCNCGTYNGYCTYWHQSTFNGVNWYQPKYQSGVCVRTSERACARRRRRRSVDENSEENLEYQNLISKYQSKDKLFQFIDTLELRLFSRADVNGDGFIDRNELSNVTKDGFGMEEIGYSKKDLDSEFYSIDLNADGLISPYEFDSSMPELSNEDN